MGVISQLFAPWSISNYVWKLIVIVALIVIVVYYTSFRKEKRYQFNAMLIIDEEALQWLRKQTTEQFMPPRFPKTEDAIKFVEQLYEAGAVEVTLLCGFDQSGYMNQSGTFVAVTLDVTLPRAVMLREKLFHIYNSETTQHRNVFSNGQQISDQGEESLMFYWANRIQEGESDDDDNIS
jgi:hypothetical protein